VVAESALNVACGGGRPIALVDCLNFGNPEHPEVMWQLSESIDGMGDACRALKIPVIGGNVSLYNESRGRDIHPTPVVAVLGLIDRLERPPPGPRLSDGAVILQVGVENDGRLAGSRWAWDVHGHRGGRLPSLDLAAHLQLIEVVRVLVNDGVVDGVHDVGEGGLAVALAEMAIGGGVGFDVDGVTGPAALFGEAPSRVVLAVRPQREAEVREHAAASNCSVVWLGVAGGNVLRFAGEFEVSLQAAASRVT
jgi:phosphoribosylformylglycinamidine synthase